MCAQVYVRVSVFTAYSIHIYTYICTVHIRYVYYTVSECVCVCVILRVPWAGSIRRSCQSTDHRLMLSKDSEESLEYRRAAETRFGLFLSHTYNSGTSLFWNQKKVSLLVRCPHFRGCKSGVLGVGKVSCLEKCLQFRTVLVEREIPL